MDDLGPLNGRRKSRFRNTNTTNSNTQSTPLTNLNNVVDRYIYIYALSSIRGICMTDTKTARTMCRKCLENSVCDIRQVIMFYQPIQQDHPNPDYTLENIFKAGAGECPFYRVNDEEGE